MIQFIPIISSVILSGIFLYLSNLISLGSRSDAFFVYYLNLISQPLKYSLFWLAVAVVVSFGLLVWLALTFLKFSMKLTDWRALFAERLREIPSFLKRESVFFAKYALPAGFSFFLVAFILGYVNQINSVNLKDEILMSFDKTIFGVYPGLYLSSFSYPDWFPKAVIFFFENLVSVVAIAAAYLYFRTKPLFKKFSVSLCLSLLFMLPLWMTFPALSPHDRFIDNVYNLPIAEVLSQKIAEYKPSAFVGEFLLEMRNKKEASGTPYLPTSTLPSAHVAWAVIAGFYLFKAKRVLGIIALPPLIFSSFGTVFLAQHYFVDVLGGAGVGLLAIVFAML